MSALCHERTLSGAPALSLQSDSLHLSSHIYDGLLALGAQLFDGLRVQIELLQIDHADRLVIIGFVVVAQALRITGGGDHRVVGVYYAVAFFSRDTDRNVEIVEDMEDLQDALFRRVRGN
jgi:hypothetical protein